MRKPNLNLSAEERVALQGMKHHEIMEAAKDDPDAREMTAEMLTRSVPDARLERSEAKRIAAARVLIKQARAEAEALQEREKTSG